MAQDDISFGITGENAAFLRALRESQDAVKGAAEQMHSSFEAVSGVFESLTGALGLFSAALAGGAAFKEAIEATVELTVGAEDLGRQFGISATQASVLRVALDDAHVSSETFRAAGTAMTRQLNQHEEAFKAAGIATREAGGELRNQLDIMQDAIDHLAGLKEGTDRNIEGQRLFGRAWGEMGRIVNVTSEAMREAAEKSDALGLSVGVEQVTAVNRYRTAMNDVNDVMTAFKNVMGQAVMPILSDVGEWFSGIGPGSVEAFRIALASLALPFRVVALGFRVIYETGYAVFSQLAQIALTSAAVLERVLHLDKTGAEQAWRDGMSKLAQIGQEYWDRIASDAQKTQDKIVNSFANAIIGPKATPTASGGGGAVDPDNTEKRKQLIEEMVEYAENLELQLARERVRLSAEMNAVNLKSAEDEKQRIQEITDLEVSSAEYTFNLHARLDRERAALQQQLRALDERTAQDFKQRWSTVSSAISSSFSQAISGMMRGTMTFADSMRNIFGSVVDALIQMFVQLGVQWVEELIIQKVMQKSTAASGISANAGLAATAAMASVAAIPFYGWAMAPAVGATTFAEAMAYEASTAAAGGFDIPSGVNPVTQLHQREMVLPANIADPLRDMVGTGSGRNSRGPSHTINFRDMGGGYMLVHQGNLAEMLKKLGAQFKLS